MGGQPLDGEQVVRKPVVERHVELTRSSTSRSTPVSAVLLGCAVTLLLLPGVGHRLPSATGGIHLPWWALAGAFAVADMCVFHIEVGREAHTFTLSEIPLVLGLFFASPAEVVVGRMLGELLVLTIRDRQPLIKLTFNLCLFLLECAVAELVFQSLIAGHPVTAWPAWAAAFAAIGAADLVSVVAVAIVILLQGSRSRPGRLAVAATITAACNTAVALAGAILATADPLAIVLLAVIAAAVFAAYRAYSVLSRRYDGLERLYEFTKATSGARLATAAVEQILAESRRLLRADQAMILLQPGDDANRLQFCSSAETPFGQSERASLPQHLLQAVVEERQTIVIPRTTRRPAERAVLDEMGVGDLIVAPLLAGGESTGAIWVADRHSTVSTFDADDARLFATIAAQVGGALADEQLIEQLHRRVEERELEALHDALTGLPNRTLFSRELRNAIDDASASHTILLIDLDGFKEINDTLGHDAGDRLLIEMSRRLTRVVGDRGVPARLGGDEFAVLLRDTDVALGVQAAQGIHAELSRAYHLAAVALEVGASVGVAAFPDHGTDPSTLLRHADSAMYDAKRRRAHVACYNPESGLNTGQRLQLADDLRTALDTEQVGVHYQPIVGVADGRIEGVEALARWRHPKLGDIPPDVFIPIAETVGLIDELTALVIQRSLQQLHVWRLAGLDLRVAVNVPVQAFLDLTFPGRVGQLLRAAGCPASGLMLEITENGIMTEPERVIGVLDQIAATGVRIAVDDFGTGYSSLSYLHRLPVSVVKVDRSLVQPITHDRAAATIVRSIIDLARNLDLMVIAEGVEDQATLDALASLGCERAQGFHVSRPRPGPELTTWLLSGGKPASVLAAG